MNKMDTVNQVKGKVEQLSDVMMKERLRPLAGRAVERLKELMESRNDAIAMGAAKMVLNKFVPDLKVTELQGNEEKPILINLDIKGVAHDELHRASTVSTEATAGV